MTDFHGLELATVKQQKATIAPGSEHMFSTNFWHDTHVRIQNSNVVGNLQVWALGKMQGQGSVPANYDHTDERPTHGVDVTCKNTGKSTLDITVW